MAAWLRIAVFSALAFGFDAQAFAQQPPAPSPAQLVPQGSPLPFIEPQALPAVRPDVTIVPPGALTSDAPTTPTSVRSVTIDGATVFSNAVLAPLVAGLVGSATPLRSIDEARIAILRKYVERGYELTDVSANRDSQGNLRFSIVEGRIAEVRLEGNIGAAGTQVLRFLNRLNTGGPITTAMLERYLLLAQDVPGVTVRAVLRPSQAEPGALTLVAEVSRQAIGGLATVDNRAFRQTGPQELLTALTFNSFTALGEQSQVSIFHSFPNTQTFGQASTEFFIGGSGLKLRFYGGSGTASPSGDLRALGYNGTTTVFGAQLSYPLIRSRAQTLTLTGLFDALQSTIDTSTGPGGTTARASYDSLRISRLGADYVLNDLVLGNARPGVDSAVVRVSQGIPYFGASHNGDPLAGRTGERVDFEKGTIEVSRDQTMFHPWADATVSLYGLAAGQIADEILPPSEKFFLGGSRLARGFYAGEVSGDSALALTAELRLTTALTVPVFGHPIDIGSQFYAFFDYGQTWERQPEDPNRQLRSAGGGVRLSITKYTEIDLEGVARFTRYPQGQGQNVSALKGETFYWQVLTRF